MSVVVWALVICAGVAASEEPRGSITSIEEFPSLGQVEAWGSETWLQRCAGSIITNRHLLSTATCFSGPDYDAAYRRVRVGSSYRGVGGQVRGVEKALLHYTFGTLGQDGDIAIVRLDDYIYFGDTVQQIYILGEGIELPTGLAVQHAGFGKTAEGRPIASDDLYRLQLFVHNQEDCLLKYYGTQEITENMVCVGSNYSTGRDLDVVDIGAPLIYEDTLVGILSFGKEADDEYPIVATAIGSYTSWISDNAV